MTTSMTNITQELFGQALHLKEVIAINFPQEERPADLKHRGPIPFMDITQTFWLMRFMS